MLKFLERKVEIVLLIGIVFIVISPFLFTRDALWIDFSKTGEIGSTIGGITAPITGILGALLIYFALNAQRKANNIQSENNMVQLILTMIIQLEKKCVEFEFQPENTEKRIGIGAFNSIGSILFFNKTIRKYAGLKDNEYFTDLLSTVRFGNYYNIISEAAIIVEMLDDSVLSDNSKRILIQKFVAVYSVYLRRSVNRLTKFYKDALVNWKVKTDRYLESIISLQEKMEKYNAQ